MDATPPSCPFLADRQYSSPGVALCLVTRLQVLVVLMTSVSSRSSPSTQALPRYFFLSQNLHCWVITMGLPSFWKSSLYAFRYGRHTSPSCIFSGKIRPSFVMSAGSSDFSKTPLHVAPNALNCTGSMMFASFARPGVVVTPAAFIINIFSTPSFPSTTIAKLTMLNVEVPFFSPIPSVSNCVPNSLTTVTFSIGNIVACDPESINAISVISVPPW